MSTETKPLYMVSMRLDATHLMNLGRRLHLPMRDVDPGYLVHCQLGELFGDRAPGVFSIVSDQGRYWRVLAYGDHDSKSLRSQADTYADPVIHSAVDWESFASKEMPSEWSEGMRLGFETRVCPVIRTSKETDRHRKGAEVDAFLARCWEVGPEVSVDREEVYRGWLSDQLQRHGGVTVSAAKVQSFQRQHLVRRSHGENRKAHVTERPDIRVQGELVVSNASEFISLLRRGIGRHRAFGFGMLLLRPITSSC